MQFLPVYIALVVFGLLWRKSSTAYDVVVIAFLTLAIYLNTTNADYPTFVEYYYYPDHFAEASLFGSKVEPGWYLVSCIGRALHLSYNFAEAALTCGALTLLRHALTKVGANRSLFWGLFLIYPALISLVQLRQFVSLAIVLYGFIVFTRGGKRGWVLFIVSIVVGVLFHRSSIVFVLLLFVPLLEKLSPLVRIALIAAVFGAAALAIFNADTLLMPFLGSKVVNGYLTTFAPELPMRKAAGSVLIVLTFAALLVFQAFFAKRASALDGNVHRREHTAHFVRYAIYAAGFGLAIIPLAILDVDNIRLYRGFFMVALIASAVLDCSLEKSLAARYCWRSAFVVLALCSSIFLVNDVDFGWVTKSLLTFTGIPAPFF